MDRIILHADLNSFFASVECIYAPALREVPMAVAGDAEQRHGIILAKNERAKRFGVKTAEPIWQARRKCPALVTVAPHHDRYLAYSRRVREFYRRYTDRVESFGLDECWLDVSANPAARKDPAAFADALRAEVYAETGLTVSVGVSWNKIFAKLGSDMKKPDATTLISREDYRSRVWPLPASALLFVGRATESALHRCGIYTIGEIAAAKPQLMQSILGKSGRELWVYANGLDESPVACADDREEVKTVGNSMTTPADIRTAQEAKKVILLLSESVAHRLRRLGLKCGTVQISLKDVHFHVMERQAKLVIPSFATGEIAQKAMELLNAHYTFAQPLRLIGVRACELISVADGEQMMFFDDAKRHERLEKLEQSIDRIRDKYGEKALRRALLLEDRNGDGD